jgi:hypothetical protein
MIMAKVTTRRKNPNWTRNVARNLEEAGKWECAIGFPKNKGLGNPHYTTKGAGGKQNPGPSILEVAIWNNYGATVQHPGGTPYKREMTSNGGYAMGGEEFKVRFVKKSSRRAAELPKTKPHTITIPPRPFMEQAAEALKRDWKGMGMREAFLAGFKRSGKFLDDLLAALDAAGVMGVGEIEKAIGNGGFQRNAPSTIRRKGSSKPLMDTGALKGAATYDVRRMGE